MALIICCAAAAQASAAAPSLLWKVPADGQAGVDAGRFRAPFGVAVDPLSGHLYVAESGNSRIAELSVWGEFVKTWGWGVVASGPDNKAPKNERQELTINATAGTYKLIHYNTFDSSGTGAASTQITAPIPYNASASTVQAALEETESLGSGDFTVNGSDGGPFTVEFVGEYADFDVPPTRVDTAGLTGTASVKTLQGGGSFEVCVPANGDVCQAGQRGGNAPGQLPALSNGVAVDGNGNVYVYEVSPEDRGEGTSLRVQKFDSGGNFLAMWGGDVNQTKASEGAPEAQRNLCTKAQVEAGDICGRGVPGTGKAQFQTVFSPGGKVAVGPSGSIFVADKDRIQKFNPNGVFEGKFDLPGESIQTLAMDSAGSFYISLGAGVPLKPDVRKFVPSGEGVTQTMVFPSKGTGPRGITVDPGGNVYIAETVSTTPGDFTKVIAYDGLGNELIGYDEHFAEGKASSIMGLATSEACGIAGADLYVASGGESTVSAYGPPPDPDLCPPPTVPPTISDQYAAAVAADDATLRAKINPHFWPDTRYYVEYGTGKCSEGACDQQTTAAPGLLLSNSTIDAPLQAEAFLSGLEPGTTYHYRFVTESSGGGPVKGLGGTVGSDGVEGTFVTHALPKLDTDCPNQAFRIGASAALPDCRAYEMVSPVNKNGSDIAVLYNGGSGAPAALNQSSTDGERLAYSTFKAFGDAQSSPFTSSYIASRGADGWSTHGIAPPRGLTVFTEFVANATTNQFKAFSPDLCSAWIMDDTDQTLAPGAVSGFANLYRRDNCGEEADTYSALSTVAPPKISPSFFVPEVQGFSADNSRTIFRVRDALTLNAPDLNGEPLLYESFGAGKLRLVCVLPDGTPVSKQCSAGTSQGIFNSYGRSASLSNAISADGSRIYWSTLKETNGVGPLYVRIGGKETRQVTGASAQYLTAADDGSRAIYAVGNLGSGGNAVDLFEYDIEADESRLIAGRVDGLLGASEDASHVYLVSREALDGGAPVGKPNLYLYEEGDFTFIATLSNADAVATPNGSFTPVAVEPRYHTAQVSQDGESVAFMSTASLTGYDNTDLRSGEADTEVFVYDATAGKLRCASCNPTGQRPVGATLEEVNGNFTIAGQIRMSETEIYQTPRVLSRDGQRVFFESYDALSLADTNGGQDVYQWEAAGKGDCTEQSPSFSMVNEGCVSLISSGQSPDPSGVYAVDADGSDVFIATTASFLLQDTGLVDVYDARIGGGYPTPIEASACEGEACQGPLSPPSDPTPASSTYAGPGNPKPDVKKPAKKRRTTKRKGEKKAKAKQHRGKTKKANRNGRAGR